MDRKILVAILAVSLLAAACRPKEPAASTEPAASSNAEATPPAGTAAPPSSAPAAATTTAPAAGTPTTVASQETNWPGIAADVTEFRRKGNTLTAKVVLRNHGTDEVQTEILYKEVYVMDLGGGRKYEVLRDEKGTYIAALRSGWTDRWYDTLKPTQSFTLWMKFPAPPADVRSVTLQLPGMSPFEDLPIQDV